MFKYIRIFKILYYYYINVQTNHLSIIIILIYNNLQQMHLETITKVYYNLM